VDEQVFVEELGPTQKGVRRLSADAVRKHVLKGVSKIQFVVDDTPPLEKYARLAEGIVERLAGDAEWKER
jgi:hypothetical protein